MVTGAKNVKTLLEIIRMDFAASGRRRKLTRAFVAQWRKENPAYGNAPLNAYFISGSAMAQRPFTRLERATAAWVEAGRPKPGQQGFDADAFNEFVEQYRDEYDIEADD
jgi:hypothetical protein